jgi:hypothetical protein
MRARLANSEYKTSCGHSNIECFTVHDGSMYCHICGQYMQSWIDSRILTCTHTANTLNEMERLARLLASNYVAPAGIEKRELTYHSSSSCLIS